MTTLDEMFGELRHVVQALGPYRDVVVLAGGFVPLVYRKIDLFDPPPHAALLSGDGSARTQVQRWYSVFVNMKFVIN